MNPVFRNKYLKTFVSFFLVTEKKCEKTRIIFNFLKKNPSGAWVREIARRTGLDKSTVSRCLTSMNNQTEFYSVGPCKMIRLKVKK
jgi:predicted transcriptional regulator with HTH domain